jgi:hypothetical protein
VITKARDGVGQSGNNKGEEGGMGVFASFAFVSDVVDGVGNGAGAVGAGGFPGAGGFSGRGIQIRDAARKIRPKKLRTTKVELRMLNHLRARAKVGLDTSRKSKTIAFCTSWENPKRLSMRILMQVLTVFFQRLPSLATNFCRIPGPPHLG